MERPEQTFWPAQYLTVVLSTFYPVHNCAPPPNKPYCKSLKETGSYSSVFPMETLVHIVGTQYMCVARTDGWLDWLLLVCCRNGLSLQMKYVNRAPNACWQVTANFPMADGRQHSCHLTVAGKIWLIKYSFNLALG